MYKSQDKKHGRLRRNLPYCNCYCFRRCLGVDLKGFAGNGDDVAFLVVRLNLERVVILGLLKADIVAELGGLDLTVKAVVVIHIDLVCLSLLNSLPAYVHGVLGGGGELADDVESLGICYVIAAGAVLRDELALSVNRSEAEGEGLACEVGAEGGLGNGAGTLLGLADLLETAVSGFEVDVVQRRAGNSVPGQGDVVILADLA